MITPKKRAYAEARLRGLNCIEAALEAGSLKKNAKANSHRWENDKDVIEYKAMITHRVEHRMGAVNAKHPSDYEIDEKIPHGGEEYTNPLKVLERIMNDPNATFKDRIAAAKELNAYLGVKPSTPGKRQEQIENARNTAGGKFAAAPPPQVVGV